MAKLRFGSLLLIGVNLLVGGCAASAEEESEVGMQERSIAEKDEALRIARPSRSLRVAVVGAGPSGLTAANTLKGLGYKNVTVFEKNDRVGGKVYSFHSGSRVTELGAVFASPEYKLVLGLAEKYDIPYVTYSGEQRIVDENGNPQPAADFLTSRYSTAEILAATVAYTAALALFFPNTQNGFATIPPQPDLYMPFGEFAKKYGFTPVAELARSVMVGFGYDYYETTPAIYYMKLLPWLIKPSATKGLEQATYYTFPTGFQSIWQAVASELDVRLNSEVTSIKRPAPSGAPVQITIGGAQTYDFDEVIVSAPLNKVSKFMSLTKKESALFSNVESTRYEVSLFTAAGLQPGTLFFHNNSRPAGINHVVAWAHPSPLLPVQSWQIVDRNISQEQITSTLAADVAAQGGTFGNLLLRQEWEDYFPRAKEAALRDGFYYKLEALQGDNHTFYVGGAMSFETVEHAARYAEQTVRLRFWPAFLP